MCIRDREYIMGTWKNLDTLSSYDKLSGLKNHVDIATAMSGEQGGERVKNYSTPIIVKLYTQFSFYFRKNRPILKLELKQ